MSKFVHWMVAAALATAVGCSDDDAPEVPPPADQDDDSSSAEESGDGDADPPAQGDGDGDGDADPPGDGDADPPGDGDADPPGDGDGEMEEPPDEGEVDPALLEACTPGVTLNLEDTDPTRSKLFLDAAEGDPEGFMQDIGRGVCSLLYRKPEEVRDATHLTLHIRHAPGEVAWKAGNGADIEVMISTDHLSNVAAEGRDVAYEVKGILYHEMTHMYQHDDSDGQGGDLDIGLIEGIADYVRFSAGYPRDGAAPDPNGNWNDGYRTTAFFLLWLDEAYPDSVYQLNLSMDERDGKTWTKATFEELTGKTVEELWQDYRDTF